MATILIAEDDPAVALVLRRALNAAGWATVQATDGLAVINAVTCHRPGLILLDLQMPLLQGAAAVRAIRDIDQAVPILIMSGSRDEDPHFGACRAAGASAALLKPFRMTVLLRAIAALAAGEPVDPADNAMVGGSD